MTATLTDGSNSIAITISDYSCPDLKYHGQPIDDDYDANWLTIAIAVTKGEERAVLPNEDLLLNWEILGLIRWLDTVADGKRPRFGFSGIEMYPDFKLSDDDVWVKVRPWSDCPIEQVAIECHADNMRRFAAELRRDVSAFPLRRLQPHGRVYAMQLQDAARSGQPVILLSARLVDDGTLEDRWNAVIGGRFAITAGSRRYGLSRRASEFRQALIGQIWEHGGASILGFHAFSIGPGELVVAVFPGLADAAATGSNIVRLGAEVGFPLGVGLCSCRFAGADWEPGAAATQFASVLAGAAEPGTLRACDEVRAELRVRGIELS